MARHRNDILFDLRLANFYRDSLKVRLALLLELNENENDIAAHAGERLAEMDEEISRISEIDAENRAIAIRELVAEYETYRQYPIIKTKHTREWKHTHEVLKPLWMTIITKEEGDKLAELQQQFEQVLPVDWNHTAWLQQANQTISIYNKILKACERTWQARSEQAAELKCEIENTIKNIRTEVMRRT